MGIILEKPEEVKFYKVKETYEEIGKTADQMFEELEYKKICFLGDIIYEKNNIQIIFDFTKKKVVIHEKNILELELIQAINKKVKELGWNE